MLTAALAASAQSTEVQYLSGHGSDDGIVWDFRCSKGMNSGRWSKIKVPSCWEQQGFGEYTYGRYYKKKDGKVSDETAIYRRSFNVPAAWRGKTVELVFDGVMTDATVTVNGQSAGETHRGGFTRFSYDISSLLQYGKKNKVEVSVAKQSSDKSVNAAERRADWWLFGGIYRPVYLRALPPTHISHAIIDARADGRLSVRLLASGLSNGYKLQTTVAGLGTQTSALSSTAEQTVSTTWQGMRLWDTEHPNLYAVTLRLIAPDGSVAHEVTQKTGFRTIEFRRRDGFYLNGTKLRIKGVNRHCFQPETGRTTSRTLDLADVKLIKGMNANAIRSHYPPDEHLLQLCDSLGVLYFDELPGWQNHYSTATGSRILKEMLLRDANHPCVFAWGNGNEGGFNLALDSLFSRYDPQQRHVVHPWALYDGVDAHHYPAYQTGVARLANGYNVFMPTEFLHSQYDKGGGASLYDYWTSWSRNPLFAGGFIWAFADEGVMRTDRDGVIDTDGGNAPDGIVGPHREKEGSWYAIRDVWSPIQIAPLAVRPDWNGRITITNNMLFSTLGEVNLQYSVLECLPPMHGSKEAKTVLTNGRVDVANVLPGESAVATIALTDKAKGGDVLQMVALDGHGDTINVWAWPMKYADEYFTAHSSATASASATQKAEGAARKSAPTSKPVKRRGKLSRSSSPNCDQTKRDKCAEANGTTLSAPCGVTATFDSATAMLTSVTSHGKSVPFNNGPLPVGMKSKLKSVAVRQDGTDALLVAKYTGAVDSIVWRMTADGLLGMDAVLLNRRDGGGFEGEFFDKDVRDLGFSFSYPEECAKGMDWLGRGPYRVWRNRQQGMAFGMWQKAYNNTVTGDSRLPLIYPEFKGYHANMYWAEMQSDTAPFTVYSETDGLYLRVFTPEEPAVRNNGENTMQDFPEGDISFLLEIPGIRSYKPIEQLGPQAQPSHIRINKGDEGLRIKLWFDFQRDN